MKIAAVIPARMQSKRLPGKPLLRIAGVPMILRVLARARACGEIGRVIVATDSEEVLRTVREYGGEAQLTSPHHATGSDRVAEVAEALPEEFILNIQGDEPLLPLSTLRTLIGFGLSRPQLTVATAMLPLTERREVLDPNVVKVVASRSQLALYFSRSPIPYMRDFPAGLPAGGESAEPLAGFRKHIGIYLYQRDFLLKFVRMEQTPLEKAESLEQMRVLEHGYPIHIVQVAEDSLNVDTPDDLARVEALLAEGGSGCRD